MLSNFLRDAVVVIFVLGFMIFIHELGHFLAAKFFGVRVLTFSLGFGMRLFGYKRGRGFSFGPLREPDPAAATQETDYRVSALPPHPIAIAANALVQSVHQTDYRVSALPFGGYVKMAGDEPSQVTGKDPGEFLS